MELAVNQESRIEWWDRVIARQRSARVTLAQFSREIGVTRRVFYYWNRRVREAVAASARRVLAPASSQRATAPSRVETTSSVPVSIIGTGAVAPVAKTDRSIIPRFASGRELGDATPRAGWV
jgi:hypothetical protein